MTRLTVPTLASRRIFECLQGQAKFKGAGYALFHGDAANKLRLIPDATVNTCLTSPPYWSVRDYEHDKQLGLEDDPNAYIRRLVEILSQVRRVLTPEGSLWLNIGDTYLGSADQGNQTWIRGKQLALMPYRVAIALEEDGWIVRNVIVWHKPNAMPSSVRDRLTNTWEPVFLLTKSERYYFDLDSIRVPHKTDDSVERLRATTGRNRGKASGDKSLRRWLNSPRHRATIDGFTEIRRRPNAPDPTKLAAFLRRAAEERGVSIRWIATELGQPFERVRHYFRTDRVGSRLPPEETWEKLKELLDLNSDYDEAMEVEVGDNIFRNHPMGRNPGDFQSFALNGTSVGHFAVMPDALARWALTATLPPNGVCLDPFVGSGTTGRVARELGGRFIGIDVRNDYLEDSVNTLTSIPYQESLF